MTFRSLKAAPWRKALILSRCRLKYTEVQGQGGEGLRLGSHPSLGSSNRIFCSPEQQKQTVPTEIVRSCRTAVVTEPSLSLTSVEGKTKMSPFNIN